MAKKRTAIPPKIKEQLRIEARNKCANPGCNILRTHIHHIEHWAVYGTHDDKQMIAVCPNCHDAIHHGRIPLTDETIYNWKKIDYSTEFIRDHLYITPNTTSKILFGSISIQIPQETIIFQLSPNNQLRFQIVGQDILMLDLNLSKVSGDAILRVEQNHITHQKDPEVEYRQTPGQVQILVPNNSEYVTNWVLETIRQYEPDYGCDKKIPILQIEVVNKGLLRVQGIWIENRKGIIATLQGPYFISNDLLPPHRRIVLHGEGENTIFETILVGGALFGGKGSILRMPHFD